MTLCIVPDSGYIIAPLGNLLKRHVPLDPESKAALAKSPNAPYETTVKILLYEAGYTPLTSAEVAQRFAEEVFVDRCWRERVYWWVDSDLGTYFVRVQGMDHLEPEAPRYELAVEKFVTIALGVHILVKK